MKGTKLISILFAMASGGVALAQDQGQPPIIVRIDGQELNFPNQQPVKTNGRVLVPLRGVFERLGAEVDWNPDKQSITAVRRDTRIHLIVGELDATVNNRVVHLDVPPTIIDGSTMVPLRFVSEALGEDVSWNSFQNEVDISRGVDYHIPHGDGDRGAPRTPPPARRPQDRPETRPEQSVVDIPADSVLPFKLDDRLTSFDAHVGDTFSATLMTDGDHRYMQLPTGTVVYGRVSFVKRHRGQEPGVIELKFDKLHTPGGTTIPVNGRLIGLDNPGLEHGAGGEFIAKSTVRNDRVVYTGYGPGPGIILGFRDGKHVIADAELGGWIRRTMVKDTTHRVTNDVELAPGTQLGLQLFQDINFPRGLQ